MAFGKTLAELNEIYANANEQFRKDMDAAKWVAYPDTNPLDALQKRIAQEIDFLKAEELSILVSAYSALLNTGKF